MAVILQIGHVPIHLKKSRLNTFTGKLFGRKPMSTNEKDELEKNNPELPVEENTDNNNVIEEELKPENAEAQAEEAAKNETSAEEKLKAEVAELNDKYLRLYSEFDNMKRRNAKERVELIQTAGKDILLSLLPVIDDFERAMKSVEAGADIEAVKEGVSLIHNKFVNILTQKGLKPIEAIGKEFDLDYHEAITKIPAPTADMKGKVVDEVEKGYALHDKVIRFAKVVVGE